MIDGNQYAIDQHLAEFDFEIGLELDEDCNRVEEPDEDQPRGYRPTPCNGFMEIDEGVVICSVCERIAS